MGQHALELLGIAIAQAGIQQRTGFKGRIAGIGKSRSVSWARGALAEPSLQKWRDLGGRLRPELDIDLVVRPWSKQ